MFVVFSMCPFDSLQMNILMSRRMTNKTDYIMPSCLWKFTNWPISAALEVFTARAHTVDGVEKD